MPGLHHAMARPLRGDGEAVELAREADGEVADVDHLLHLALALLQDLAGLAGDELAERSLGGAQLLAEQAYQLAAPGRRHVAPGLEGLLRLGDGGADLRRRPALEAGDLATVDRRMDDKVAGLQLGRVEIEGFQQAIDIHDCALPKLRRGGDYRIAGGARQISAAPFT